MNAILEHRKGEGPLVLHGVRLFVRPMKLLVGNKFYFKGFTDRAQKNMYRVLNERNIKLALSLSGAAMPWGL